MKKVILSFIIYLFALNLCFSQTDTLVQENKQKLKRFGISYKFSGQALSGIILDAFITPAFNMEVNFLILTGMDMAIGGGISIYPMPRSDNTILTPYFGARYGCGADFSDSFWWIFGYTEDYRVFYLPVGVSLSPNKNLNAAIDIGYAYQRVFHRNNVIAEKSGSKVKMSVKMGVRF